MKATWIAALALITPLKLLKLPKPFESSRSLKPLKLPKPLESSRSLKWPGPLQSPRPLAPLTLLILTALLAWPPPGATAPPDTQLHDLETWMTGSFSSQAQAEADTNFYDIRLEMVRIWPEREDGLWLYVEQAVASALDRPYRQRVYHVTRPATDLFASAVFTLPDPLRFAGAWKREAPLAGLAPDSLESREGCTVFLQRQPDGSFAGATRAKDCASNLRGAAYATSEVVITADGLTSWDRGYDAEGGQVWGSEHGPYVFRRVP